MDFFSLARKRHSIREFSGQQVSKDLIGKILSALRTAPSAGNLKAYKVVVIERDSEKRKLAKAANEQEFIAEAPIVFVFFACPDVSSQKYGERGIELYCLQDATIACAYAQLTATDLGLGSCWVGAFDEEKVREILSLRKNLKPVAILPIGYERK